MVIFFYDPHPQGSIKGESSSPSTILKKNL